MSNPYLIEPRKHVHTSRHFRDRSVCLYKPRKYKKPHNRLAINILKLLALTVALIWPFFFI